MKLLVLLLALALQAGTPVFSQHQNPNRPTERAATMQPITKADSLAGLLRKHGTFEGHVRTFYMGTFNHGHFPDYHALAQGGGLAYYSPVIKNFQVGMSGFIIYNVASSDLGPTDGYNNRYEIGLFDINNPDNRQNLDRLEDLYLKYYFSVEKKSFIQYGKFHLKTPLVNLQDGRMRPNLQQGLWGEWNNFERIKIKGGWLTKTSPRSTIEWFGMGQSVGVYPMGRAVNGLKADYAGHVNTPGVAIANVAWAPAKRLEVQLWNYSAPNLFNIASPRVEYKIGKLENPLSLRVMYLWQKSLYHGSHAIENQYISKGEQSHALSSSLTHTNRLGRWSLSYTRITRHGRFLFPREWGIEPFHTFMYRERMEGAGNVHALMLQNQRLLGQSKQWSLQTATGGFQLPDVNNTVLNKYGLSSFYQVYARLGYKFNGLLYGLNADLLYTYKGVMNRNLAESATNFHNKLDMHHLSLVVDYYF